MKWPTAMINDLPDSAFLWIEDGGKKVKGKTEPRSLRHFPVKDADGSIDGDHLRNALSRIPQSDAPQKVKDRIAREAGKMLERMKTKKSVLESCLACVLPEDRRYANPFADAVAPQGWRDALAKADSPETIVVLSPPDHTAASPRELAARAGALKCDFLLEYPDGPEARVELAKVGRPFQLPGGEDRLFVASFPLVTEEGVIWLDGALPEIDNGPVDAKVEKALADAAPTRICKFDEDEGTVLFVVLEPRTADNTDGQGDWYTEAQIQKAMYRYMKDYRHHTLMHKKDADGRPVPLGDAVRILENFIAPVDFDVGAEKVTKGTWLQRVWTDPKGEYFQAFKKGELGGCSIGGDAIRRKTQSLPKDYPAPGKARSSDAEE